MFKYLEEDGVDIILRVLKIGLLFKYRKVILITNLSFNLAIF